jgi:pimeloyl-ACP methyl ester carboxylesterase
VSAAADRATLAYLPGIAGHPAGSPALDALSDAGWNVVVPIIPGLDGRSGFQPPDDYLGWLTVVWDALDASGVLPCPVVGASLGGMLAADLAVFRPEAVTALVLLAPFGIFDESDPGLDLYALPAAERMSHLFAKGVPEPFVERFAELGPDDGPVARYLCDVAAASLLWPLGDRGHARRLHRIGCPTAVLWGELDELLPVAMSAAWAEHGLPVTVVPGAGHLLEWDEPDGVAGLVAAFLDGAGPTAGR